MKQVVDEFPRFSTQQDWGIISAFIDNLAEYKIVEYIYRNCWDISTGITLEEFMHGYTNADGTKTDYGTGLSKPSVIAGIKKAIEHGFIECDKDDTNKAAIRKYYRIHIVQSDVNSLYPDVKDLYPQNESDESDINDVDSTFDVKDFNPQADVKDLYPEEMALEANLPGCKDPLPPSNNSKYISTSNYSSNIFRNKEVKTHYPTFIRTRIDPISRQLGDHEHIPSNIGQAYRLFLAYIADGGTPDGFIDAMQQAREQALKATGIKKKNSQGMPNRMPLFFSCWRNLLKEKRPISSAI